MEGEVVKNMVTSDMVTKISTSVTTAATNVLNTFIDLLPVMAIICGVGFTIAFVKGLFNRTSHGK